MNLANLEPKWPSKWIEQIKFDLQGLTFFCGVPLSTSEKTKKKRTRVLRNKKAVDEIYRFRMSRGSSGTQAKTVDEIYRFRGSNSRVHSQPKSGTS